MLAEFSRKHVKWLKMLCASLSILLLAVYPHLANAADGQSWPWVVFGPDIENCAKVDEPVRKKLTHSLLRAEESTKNLLPSHIWLTYKQQITSKTGSQKASHEVREGCDFLIERLEAPNLSARLRGEFFLGLLGSAPFDCVLDDMDRGKNFLIEFRKFYERNGLEYPDQAFQTQLANMRATKWKVLNGWDTPHCMNMQRSLSTGELDLSVSEEMMRKNWFTQ